LYIKIIVLSPFYGNYYKSLNFKEGTVLLCTDNFTEEETKRLINLLENKFGLKAGLKRRINYFYF